MEQKMEVHIIISIAAVICGIFLGEVFMLGIGHIRAQDTEENYLVNASDIDNIIYDIQKDVSTFNTLLKHMERPAHAVPGDAGEDIHIQHRRVEGFVDAINDNVNCLEKLAEDTTINKEEMRSLVVSLYIQMEKLRGCTTDLGDLINEALAADKEDENALKLQDSLNEFDLAQVEVFEGIGKLETELQDPIDRGYRGRFGALNPKRLDNCQRRCKSVQLWRNKTVHLLIPELKLRGCADAGHGGVLRVARFIQPGLDHKRDRKRNRP